MKILLTGGTGFIGNNIYETLINKHFALWFNKLTPKFKNFIKGKCLHSDKCKFAHSEKELRSTPDVYKTAICHNWKNGKCKLG